MFVPESILMWITFGCWITPGLFALFNFKPGFGFSKYLNALGCITLMIVCIMQLTTASAFTFKLFDHFDGQLVMFNLNGANSWLLFFGLITAFFISLLGTTANKSNKTKRFWLFGFGMSLFGSLGVFALQDAMSFLIAWELMSLGGALMIAAEHIHKETAKNTFIMISLLEIGSVALAFGMIAMTTVSGSTEFSSFIDGAKNLPVGVQFFVGLLFVIGFGAKLGLLPFYEWFPGAYGSGSGASGALFSGIILNAAFFGLMRVFISWIPLSNATFLLGIITGFIAVASAILATLYAFAQNDWRRLLSLSSAENASIAVLLISAALICKEQGAMNLAGMASVIAIIHMSAHCLAKGCMFLTADGYFLSQDTYNIKQTGFIKQAKFMAIGAVIASMSLCAIPPTSGYLSEWYAFQLFFHGFDLNSFVGRVVLAFFGTGLALSSAIALAVFIKAFGIGLLGEPQKRINKPILIRYKLSVFLIGSAVLALAIGMPWFIRVLNDFSIMNFGTDAVAKMHVGWVMVPLSKGFAFTSPTLLSIVIPAFCIIPLLLLLTIFRFKVKRAPIWYGGRKPINALSAAGNSLTFSNALRKFYSFIYKPKEEAIQKGTGKYNSEDQNTYFTKKVTFREKIHHLFVVKLFEPTLNTMEAIYLKIQRVQSGNINEYNSVFIVLIILILATVFI